MKTILKSILYIFIHFILLSVRQIFNLKIAFVYTSRIGHLCYNADNLISKDVNCHIIFICEERIANNLILSKIKEKNKVYFLMYPQIAFLATPFLKFKIFEDNYARWKEDLHPRISFVSLKPQLIFVSNEEILSFRKKIKTDKFICFHNRDSEYLKNMKINDQNFHDYRDFDFESYKKSIQELKEHGIDSVRLGQIVQREKLNFNYLDLTESNRTEENELLAIASSLFQVTGNTGFAQISRILRKPQLIVNQVPFLINELSAYASNTIIVPKKLFSIRLNRYLKLNECYVFCKKYTIHDGDYFENEQIVVENNTQDEICAAIFEMLDWIDSGFNPSCSEISEAIDQTLLESEYNLIKSKLNIRISESFLEKNNFLL